MKKVAIAAGIGLLSALVLGGIYLVALFGGLKPTPSQVMIGAALLAFASTSAVFALLILTRTAPTTPYQRSRLNQLPALQKISEFMDGEKVQILARPEQSLAEIMVRHSAMFKKPDAYKDRKVVVRLHASDRKGFNPVILRGLFGALAPFKLEHVILFDADGQFAGYIPGDRALKDFNGDNAETKIAKAIVDMLGQPSDESVKAFRGMNGIPKNGTVSETDNIRHAAALVYTDETLPGLVVHKNLRPVGVISKADLLILASAEPMIAGY